MIYLVIVFAVGFISLAALLLLSSKPEKSSPHEKAKIVEIVRNPIVLRQRYKTSYQDNTRYPMALRQRYQDYYRYERKMLIDKFLQEVAKHIEIKESDDQVELKLMIYPRNEIDRQ